MQCHFAQVSFSILLKRKRSRKGAKAKIPKIIRAAKKAFTGKRVKTSVHNENPIILANKIKIS